MNLTMSRRIFSEVSTILLAVGMAFLVWIAAVTQEDPVITKDFQQQIPVKLVAPAQNLSLVGQEDKPPTVQVRLRAPESVWQVLTPEKIKVLADLSLYPAGIYEVPLNVTVPDLQATVIDVIPSQLTVQLEPITQKTLPVFVQIMDSPAQGYLNRSATSLPISTTVRGASVTVEQVERVVAKVYLNNSKETVQKQITFAAHNANNELVKNITLEPPGGLVTVPIEQRFGYKDVSVKAQVTGQPANGYWISSISVEPATVTLQGGPSVLGDVSGFIETAAIDISGSTETVIRRVPLNLPLGASTVDDDSGNVEAERGVLVTIGVSALTGGRTMQVGLTVQGVAQNLTWTAAPKTVEAIISGPLPVLQKLTEADLTLIIDLFSQPAGVYRIEPDILHPDGVEITSVIPDTIEITLKPAAASLSGSTGLTSTLTLTGTDTTSAFTTSVEATGPLTKTGLITQTENQD